MPLIVPGVQTSLSGSNIDASASNNVADWSAKLLGKKLGGASDDTTFARSQLPGGARVVEHGGMMTMDHQPERMNVHLGEDGTVHKVTKG